MRRKKILGVFVVLAAFLMAGVSTASAQDWTSGDILRETHEDFQDGQLDGSGINYTTYEDTEEVLEIEDGETEAKSVHQTSFDYFKGDKLNYELPVLPENTSVTAEFIVQLENGTSDTYTYDLEEGANEVNITEIGEYEDVDYVEQTIIIDREDTSTDSPVFNVYHFQYEEAEAEEVNYSIETYNRSPEEREIIIGEGSSFNVTLEATVDTNEDVNYEIVNNGNVVDSDGLPAGEGYVISSENEVENNAEHEYKIRFLDPDTGDTVEETSTYTYYTQDSESPTLEEISFSGEKDSTSTGMNLIILGIGVSTVIGAIGIAFRG